MAASPSAAVLERLKDSGNKSFALGKWASARELYTEALTLLPSTGCPDELKRIASVLHSNRALAVKNAASDAAARGAETGAAGEAAAMLPSSLAPWALVEADAASAIELDAHNAKAHYIRGVCLCRKREWVAGVRSLELARSMAKRQNKPATLLKEFEGAIAAGRFEWWRAHTREESYEDVVLQSFFQDLLSGAAAGAQAKAQQALVRPGTAATLSADAIRARAMQRPSTATYVADLSDAAANANPRAHRAAASAGVGPAQPTTCAAAEAAAPSAAAAEPFLLSAAAGRADGPMPSAAEIEAALLRRRSDLADVFGQRERQRAEGVPATPTYFTCSITMEVMLDPVITPCGHSYERAALECYLKTVKAEDPLSRRVLTVDKLVPNIALRNAIAAYLAERPWAHPQLPRDREGNVATTGMEGAAEAN